MSVPFETVFNQLQYSSPVKAKQILRDLEAKPDELIQFCRQARKLSSVRAAALSKMLIGMSNPEFLQLLKVYALGDDNDLRNTAFETLSRVNNTAKKEVMIELFHASEPIIRQKACEAIVEGIDSEEEGQLIKLLEDSAVNVVRAALLVLANSTHKAVLKKCEDLLDNKDAEVRFLALGILGNAEAKQFVIKKVSKVLYEDTDDRIRIEACRILAAKNPDKARDVLVATLQNTANSDLLRQHAVRAVARINGSDAVTVLFNVIIEDKFCSGVVGECRNALGRFEPAVIISLAERKFRGGSVLEKFECVRILGMFASSATDNFLVAKLRSSQNSVVLAAIIEQLAKAGVLKIWEFVVNAASSNSSMVVAYSAAQAAAELLTPDKFADFVGILKDSKSCMVEEVILKRLVVYGKDRGLPLSIKDIVGSYLKGGRTALNLFAIDAAGYVEGAELVPQLLDLVNEYSELRLMDELTHSIMNGVGGSLYKLLLIAGEERLREVSAILSRVNRNDIADEFSDFFAYLAREAEKKTTGAQLCLTISASRFHREYIEALPEVGDKELAYLLFTWSSLPQSIRDSSAFDWSLVLSSQRISVRVAALRAMTDADIENNIAEVADIAFADPRIEGREAAAKALRGVLNN